eukprot:3023094-Amphidinium_carterae.1
MLEDDVRGCQRAFGQNQVCSKSKIVAEVCPAGSVASSPQSSACTECVAGTISRVEVRILALSTYQIPTSPLPAVAWVASKGICPTVAHIHLAPRLVGAWLSIACVVGFQV